MADTRCANPAYQLDVDEMTLEYLIYNTLKAHVEEWEPDYRSNSPAERLIRDPTTASKPRQAPILLAILDTTVQVFKTNHPNHPWTENTAFYFGLLEFLVLFSHRRGGPSVVSEASCLSAREIGKENVQRRYRCWEAYAQLGIPSMGVSMGVERILLMNGFPDERTHESEDTTRRPVPLSSLLPLFMEISAQILELTRTDVSSMWMRLAAEFTLQAAIESSASQRSISRTVQACLGWGLPISAPKFSLVTSVEDRDIADMERKIHAMLRAADGEGNEVSQTPSWDSIRLQVIEEVLMYHASGHRPNKTLDEELQDFESQVLHYIQNLQALWGQLNGLPTLLQIEQGGLEEVDDEEFKAFMERVGDEEHDARVERMEFPVISKV